MSAAPVARAAGIVGVVVALVVARVLVGAAQEYDQGSAREAAGEPWPAISHYRRALGWYVPLSPYGPRALGRLVAIADGARARGDLGLSAYAERAIHGGAQAARSIGQPYAADVAAADGRLSALTAPLRGEGVIERRLPDPSAAWSLVALCAWLAFAGASFALILRPVDAAGRFATPPFRLLGAMAVATLVFALALLLA